jgi:hypothetical protein
MYKIVISADIFAFFRQILVPEADRNYQRILFRFDPSGPLEEYRLETVTYGLQCSSFCSASALRFIAENLTDHAPTRFALTESTYVDDCLTTHGVFLLHLS